MKSPAWRLSDQHREWLLNGIAIAICAVFLFPIYWLIVTSLKTEAEIFRTPPTLFPTAVQFKNYIVESSGGFSIYRSFFNSMLISLSTMVISMALSTPAAYGMARYNMSFKKTMLLLFLVTQMMPPTLILTPLFIIFKQARVLNTYLAPIIADCTIAIPFSVLTLRTYFLSIPKELEESARIDGCNKFVAFMRIMIPVSYPGVIVSAAFSFLFAWGNLIYPLTYLTNQAMRPLTAGIYNFIIAEYGISWNRVMAFGVLTVLPVIVIFISLQKYLVGGLTTGTVKG
ncbi:carbohydrate ABC transporter membrane protein 2 (CUT1 family) [Hydrogenispora ethanolica]|jgi:multiple sugar transport system permease protein|uniref:Carbohydrate ABC transporter membrane protein 2 (CUT1 family) n=1 Tax=Hydrogenispora ethanolica TaxID=1082276 RepID=A0A4R1R8F5_HYDET|nr:carbohydrate ABC transporter permease [Hydrogenispora ethanolica]TCL61926.1 carbohydrate ABC transporter membrane protein 2 (CUT1 family) [Hydrogenispora ethanolica]